MTALRCFRWPKNSLTLTPNLTGAVAAGKGPRTVVRVGTRGSRLALIQTDLTLAILRAAFPDVSFEVVTVTTQGDANQTAPLAGMGLGVFVKEIERRLEAGDIDMAVHSLKDMPTVLPAGMTIGAVLERGRPAGCAGYAPGHGLGGLSVGGIDWNQQPPARPRKSPAAVPTLPLCRFEATWKLGSAKPAARSVTEP